MTDDLDEPWICKMSDREKMKHLQSVCFASEFQTNPMSEAKLVKDCTPRYAPSTLALLQNHFLEFCVEHGLELQGRDLQESFMFTQKRTHDVEPRWASDSWSTLAEIIMCRRGLPQTHIEVCVAEVREAHDVFSHLLNRGALLCRVCQLVYPPETSSTPRALQPPHLLWTRPVWQDGKAAFRRRPCTSLECLCAALRRGLSTALSLSLQMRTITRIRNCLGRPVAAACRHVPF